MQLIRLFVAVFGFLLVSASTVAHGAPVDLNVVSLTVSRDGKIVARPKILLGIGSTAFISATDKPGFSVKISLARDGRFVNGRKVDLEIFFLDGSRWMRAGQPSVVLPLDNLASVVFNDQVNRKVEVQVRVSANT